jgi:hypothetical protein
MWRLGYLDSGVGEGGGDVWKGESWGCSVRGKSG